jgi:hypothetical protein
LTEGAAALPRLNCATAAGRASIKPSVFLSFAAALPMLGSMARRCTPRALARVLRLARAVTLAAMLAALAALAPAPAGAERLTIGSPLSVPATLNTAQNLSYQGTNTQVPVSPEAPNGVFHTFHFGADTAIWNAPSRGGPVQAASTKSGAAVPAGGQILQIRLEGCAEAVAADPTPLTQIHFQTLSPLAGGGARVNLTSQSFEIPVCGQGGASGSTVSTYEPTNLCVNQGDYVAFNDEGGYVPGVYHSGVPYEVLGAIRAATADSFLRNNGTGDGAIFSPSDTSAMDGFASNPGEELLMQMLLGTGSDARYVCPGGSKDAPPALPAIGVRAQTDGINHERIVSVAVYCRLTPECKGVATLTIAGKPVSTGSQIPFSLRGNATTHLPIRLLPRLMGLIRKHHGISATLTAVVGATTVSQTINVKIF